ncbi:MAG: Trp biosynthesis-associated membrane protein [Rhodoglobus sp.]
MKWFPSRAVTMAAFIVLAAAVMLSWTQVWFSFTLSDGSHVDALGSDAVGPLATLALALFALVAALGISRVMVRRVLGMVAAAVGVVIGIISQAALADPVRASVAIITEATGISGIQSLRALVSSVDATFWPAPAIIAAILIVILGVSVTVSAHRWPGPTKKYDRAETDVADDPASQWDAQSRGIDPSAQ